MLNRRRGVGDFGVFRPVVRLDVPKKTLRGLSTKDDIVERAKAMPFLISCVVCEPDGRRALDVAKASTLRRYVQKALNDKIIEFIADRQLEKKSEPENAEASIDSGTT